MQGWIFLLTVKGGKAMKRVNVIVVGAVLVISLLLMGQDFGNSSWEYARLRYGVYTDWTWIGPDVSAEGETFDDLAQKLEVDKQQNPEDAFLIIEWAGNNGWELVTVGRRSQESTVWFKRRK